MNDTDETTEETPEELPAEKAELTLPEQHLAWKERAIEILHEYGRMMGHCTDFDRILIEIGLRPRPQHEEYLREDCRLTWEVVGEDTVEAFEEWKRNASRTLHEKAKYHGVRNYEHDVCERAGFLRRSDFIKPVEYVIEGTFRFTGIAELEDNENLIDKLPERVVRERVFDLWQTDRVQWKATVVEPTPDPEPEVVAEPEPDVA